MKNKNVLLVEPNRHIRENLKNSLEIAGDKVFVALDENEALNCLKSNEIDIILIEPILGTDFLSNKKERVRNVSSGGAGVVLLNNIKKVCTRRFKIIFYTAASFDNLFEIGIPMEETFYLRKPERTGLIIREVHRGEM